MRVSPRLCMHALARTHTHIHTLSSASRLPSTTERAWIKIVQVLLASVVCLSRAKWRGHVRRLEYSDGADPALEKRSKRSAKSVKESRALATSFSLDRDVKIAIFRQRFFLANTLEKSWRGESICRFVWSMPIAEGHSYALWPKRNDGWRAARRGAKERERESMCTKEGAPRAACVRRREEERNGTDRRLRRGSEWRHR